MNYSKIPNLRLDYINIFCTVVKYRSYTKAARELHYTQSMVSKVISTMENELQIILFIRNKDGLTLTPAGRYLYRCWEKLIAAVATDLFHAHNIQQNHINTLQVGCPDCMPDIPGLENGIKAILKKHGDAFVSVETLCGIELLRQLYEGQLDVIFLSEYDIPEDMGEEYEKKRVAVSGMCVYYFGEERKVDWESIADLAEENFIVLSPQTYPYYLQFLKRMCAQAGFIPQISCFLSGIQTIPTNIRIGNGIAVLGTEYPLAGQGIESKVLQEYSNGVYAVFRKDSRKGTLPELLEFLQTPMK